MIFILYFTIEKAICKIKTEKNLGTKKCSFSNSASK